MFRYEDQYTIKRMGEGLMSHIILTKRSKYPDIEFQYGSVRLIEEDDQLRVKFEFQVFGNPQNHDTSSPRFREYIGGLLIDLMEQELTYEIDVSKG